MPRPRPSLPLLAIPAEHIVEQWLDRFDASPIDEHVEYSLNLGAESPVSGEDDTLPSLPLERNFARRPKPTARKQEAVDRDCGICFEYAVQPARTLCCGKIFCREHITDWLSGPSSDGRCPSCSAPCSSTNILSLTSSTLPVKSFMSQGTTRVVATAAPHPSPRHRSQSESTNNSSVSSSGSEQSSTTTTSASSISPSTLCLSPAPELERPRENHFDQPWLTALMEMYHPRSVSPSLSTLAHSPDEARDSIHPRSATAEVLSRLVSVLGLTVLFYALLASS